MSGKPAQDFWLTHQIENPWEKINLLIVESWELKTELNLDFIMISATGSKPGTSLIFHNKQVTAVKVAVHFSYPILIYDI